MNKEFRGGTLRRSDVAKEFYAAEGPGFADQYFPWLVNIMPLGNTTGMTDDERRKLGAWIDAGARAP